MKNFYTLAFIFLLPMFCFSQQANLFTIPNQSAQFIRMPSRATAIDVDAVFFNPANLPSLGNGFHIDINNQILNQFSTVESEYELYTSNPKKYEGNAKSYVFPSVFVNWNINKISLHGAFMIVGGAGGADYADLPVSDRGIADVPAAITNLPGLLNLVDYDASNGTGYSNITDYRYNFQNKGVGFSPGVQLGVAYKLNKFFSFGMDFRWSQQIVSSEGEVSNIEILAETNNSALNDWMSPGDYLRAVGNEISQPAFDGIAGIYDDLGADRFINIRQKGSGFNFIPSVLIQPTEKLFIALKYEHRTKIVMTTLVRDGKDGGMQGGRPVFIDGEEIRSDLPGFISGGIGYQVTDKWRVNTGGRYMFFKGVDFNGREQYLKNGYYEVELATEYQLFDKFLISGGYTFNRAGVEEEYHNDVDFWIPGHAFALGGRVTFNPSVCIDFGAMFTRNVGQQFTYNHNYADGNALAVRPANYTGTYTMDFKKYSYIIGLGLNIKINNENETTPNLMKD
ncbi:MAG: hypothetical protein ISR01_05485 [Chitinophagales bacterium]|nr:hypothetical protein [Chitinophagales bacterium]